DPDTGQLLDTNATAQRLTGLPLCELLRLPIEEVLSFGDPSGMQRLRQATSKSSAFHAQEGNSLRTIRPDVHIPVNVTVARLHSRPTTLALITARDIREQRAASARLQQAEADLRRIMAAVSDCLWSAEIDTANHWTYRYISPGVAEIMGQPLDF